MIKRGFISLIQLLGFFALCCLVTMLIYCGFSKSLNLINWFNENKNIYPTGSLIIAVCFFIQFKVVQNNG